MNSMSSFKQGRATHRCRPHSLVWAMAMLMGSVGMASSEPVSFNASTGLSFRGFMQDALTPAQDHDTAASVFIQPEAKWRSKDRKHRFSFVGFARWDEQDPGRTHGDIRELYWSARNDSWTTTVGINKVFWGVTESVHLVDVINQTDWVEDIDQEDKLGQAMLHISKQQSWGQLQFFLLPHFRERTFPDRHARLGLGQDVIDAASYESSDEQNHLDWAFRYSHYWGDVDLGLSVFDGTQRDPLLIQTSNGKLQPHYIQMSQLGIDLQYTQDAWLWKLETLYRDSKHDQFWAMVGGFEYTWYQFKSSDADLGVLFEYQFDDRSTPVLSDNDVFMAVRYALNDNNDSSLLAGMSHDLDNGSQFFNIEAETRVNDHMTAELRLRLFSGFEPQDPGYGFSQSDYLQLNLNWHF